MARVIDSSPILTGASPRRGGPAAIANHASRTLAILCLAAALAVPASAFAAAAAAPDAGGNLDLQTWPESGQLIIVTAVSVPETAKLPATVRIPVPEGAVVQWAGEVLGGELSADPARPYKIIKSPAGGQYAEFTIEQTHTAQVDAAMPALTVNGAKTSATFEWIQAAASPFTSFSVRVPGSATDVNISPKPTGAPDTNAAGESLYSGDPLKLEPGAKQTVSFSYTTGASKPASPASSVDSLVIALGAALAVAIVALIVVVARQKRESAPAAEAPRQKRSASASTKAAEPKADSGSTSDSDWGFDDND
jgi:hypothetical protein